MMLFGMFSRYRISETNVYKVGISGGLEFLLKREEVAGIFSLLEGGMISRELVGLWVISFCISVCSLWGYAHLSKNE